MTHATSDLLDLFPDAAACGTAMHLLGRNRLASGVLRTLRCLEDNALLKATLATASPGEILVVDGSGSLCTALLGDQVAASALAHGWAAVLVFGAVRDSAQLDAMPFHIKCLGFHPRKSAKLGSGELDTVLHLGGIDFIPGHFLASDSDGIVVLPHPPAQGPASA